MGWHEHDTDTKWILPALHIPFDTSTYEEALNSSYTALSLDAMEDEIKLMTLNVAWNLVELPNECKPIACKSFIRPIKILMVSLKGTMKGWLQKGIARRR